MLWDFFIVPDSHNITHQFPTENAYAYEGESESKWIAIIL